MKKPELVVLVNYDLAITELVSSWIEEKQKSNKNFNHEIVVVTFERYALIGPYSVMFEEISRNYSPIKTLIISFNNFNQTSNLNRETIDNLIEEL